MALRANSCTVSSYVLPRVALLLVSQAPSVRIINDGTQFLPVGIARYSAVGTQDKVGRCILQHLIDGFLGLFYRTSCNDSQTFQTTEDRTAKALLRLLQIKGRTVGEVQGHVDDTGRIVGKGIESLGILERSVCRSRRCAGC